MYMTLCKFESEPGLQYDYNYYCYSHLMQLYGSFSCNCLFEWQQVLLRENLYQFISCRPLFRGAVPAALHKIVAVCVCVCVCVCVIECVFIIIKVG